jgi:hypothetical protein
MARVTQKCGGATIDYEETLCTYTCFCTPNQPCVWSVTCPGPGGKDITTSGTGHLSTPVFDPSLVIAGNLASAAKSLERVWGRRVIVPEGLREKRIRRRTLKGTPGEIANRLGLSLGAKRRTAAPRTS